MGSPVPQSAAESAAAALSLHSSAPSAQSPQLPLATQRSSPPFQARSSVSVSMTHSAQSAALSAAAAKAPRIQKTTQVSRREQFPLRSIVPQELLPGTPALLAGSSLTTWRLHRQPNSASSTAELSPSEDLSDSEANIPLSSRRKRPLTDVQKSKLLHDLFRSSDESEAEKDGASAPSITQLSSPLSLPLSTPIANPATPPSTSAGFLSSEVSPVPTSVAKAKRPRPPSPRVSVKKPRKGAKPSVVSSVSGRHPCSELEPGSGGLR
ncbi:hypothetical protein PHYPSEUDO_000653 [Phytophthora pseudosyringae]|uniref:Uncharacterized protein n=1 Tax=Phytophthora pseudosyringae TaxID=221518 RepID=A0A8T1V666_9STRA|nr:hypothetical protein PHYPSEUDO_000653 [Phytophthora pseudosyringae]